MRIISGKYGGRRLNAVVSGVRPTSDKVRGAVFNMLQEDLEGSRVLDLFAGTGALGIESLSRGALHVTFVDKSSKAIMALKKNLNDLNVPLVDYNIEVWQVDRFLKKNKNFFDIIFMDPPYGKNLVRPSLSLMELSTLKKGGRIFVEHSDKESIDITWFKSLSIIKEKKYGNTIVSIFKKDLV